MCARVRRFARVWASVRVSDVVPSRARRPLAEWLQANCSKFKKIFESEDVLAEKLKELSVSGEAKAAKDKPKLLPGGKVKKNAKPEIVLERSVRNKRKCITTVSGLDTFGIKLPEAAKLLGKKFACGSSVVKDAAGRDQIDVQGDFQFEIAELIMKKYKDKDIKEEHFYALEKARKSPLF